jgi:hypothetical protein
VHGIPSWLIDSRIPLQQVTFPFDSPRHSDAYALMFPGPVAFGASAAGYAVPERPRVVGRRYAVFPGRQPRPAAPERTTFDTLINVAVVIALIHRWGRRLFRRIHDAKR